MAPRAATLSSRRAAAADMAMRAVGGPEGGAGAAPGADIPRLRARLVLPLSLVLAVVGGGTVGYFWLWREVGGTWLDALFMTVTTITTVGYGEVKPLDSAGRIFTMVVAIVGVGSLFFTFGVVMEYLVAVRLRSEEHTSEL